MSLQDLYDLEFPSCIEESRDQGQESFMCLTFEVTCVQLLTSESCFSGEGDHNYASDASAVSGPKENKVSASADAAPGCSGDVPTLQELQPQDNKPNSDNTAAASQESVM